MTPALRLLSRRPAAGTAAAMRARPDAQLIALACDGSAEAFEAIYDRHCAAAYALAHRICGERSVAEDVVQEAFLALWRGRDRFDPDRGQVRSWLLGIVHNSAIDRLRRSGVHERRRASNEAIEERLAAPDRTDDKVEQRQLAAEVRAAVRALPEDQWRVIELAYFDGLTHTQIATRLGQPVGTIKGRMRLALLKLRTRLHGERRLIASSGEPTR